MSTRPQMDLPTPRLAVVGLFAVFAVVCEAQAFAQNQATWIAGADVWSDRKAWACVIGGKGQQCVPNGGNFAVSIVDGGSATLDINATTQSLTVDIGSGLSVGNGHFLTNFDGDLIGAVKSGSLAIATGGHVNDSIAGLGSLGGSSGTVTVSDPGSQWNVSRVLNVGIFGQGELTIENSGEVLGDGNVGTMSNSSGNVTVTGSGSLWDADDLTVGQFGQGTLTIEESGAVTVKLVTLGLGKGSSGSLTVTDSGSQLDASSGRVVVGVLGSGTLTVENGAKGFSKRLDIGFYSLGTGDVVLTDKGTRWNSYGTIVVGESGTGTLTVENEAVLASSGDLIVGDQSGGTGTLTITGGSQVRNVSGTIGNSTGSVGTVAVVGPGSAWFNMAPGTTTSAGTTLDIGINGKGTLVVADGGFVKAGMITIGTKGTVIAKTGTLETSKIAIEPGGRFDPLGVATVVGDLTLDLGATLALDVAGRGVGDFGSLDVSGFGTFDGTLSIDFINGFAPKKGETFDFINDSGGASFNFASTDILGLQPGFDYSTNSTDGQFILTALNNGVPSSPTPEPGALLLVGTGLLGVGTLAHRRSKSGTS